MHDLSNEALVPLAKDGNQDAYTELYRRLLPSLHGTICKILRKYPEETEDCVQEVAAKIFFRIHSFKGESLFSTWCVRIAINQSLMKLRMLNSRAEALSYVYYDSLPDNEKPFEPFVEEKEYAASLARHDLEKILPDVCDAFRTALIERYIYGYHFHEMAEIHQRSVGGMKSNSWRGLRRAHKIVQKLEKRKSAR